MVVMMLATLGLGQAATQLFAGFDPATAEGWKSIGIDPALGIYAVFDAAILEAGDTPIVALGVTDLDKLLAFAKKSGKEANIVADEGGLTFNLQAAGQHGVEHHEYAFISGAADQAAKGLFQL